MCLYKLEATENGELQACKNSVFFATCLRCAMYFWLDSVELTGKPEGLLQLPYYLNVFREKLDTLISRSQHQLLKFQESDLEPEIFEDVP